MRHISRACVAALAAATFIPVVPAYADHPGPSAAGSVQSGGLQIGGAETLGRGDFSLHLSTVFARPKSRSDAVLAELAGQHIHAHAIDYSLRTELGGAFGVTDRLTLSASVPFVRQDNIRGGEHSHGHGGSVANDVVHRGSVSGVGDATLLAKYRTIGRGRGGLALLAGVKAPTGSTGKRDASGERFETEHQPGSGSWDILFGAAGGMPVAALQLDGSVMYQLPGKGAMRTRLGDRLVAGLALSRRFGAPDDHHAIGEDSEPHGHSSWGLFTELTAEWEGRQEIEGEIDGDSGGKGIFLSPGARFNASTNWSAAAQVGIPLRQRVRDAHAGTGYRIAFALARAF